MVAKHDYLKDLSDLALDLASGDILELADKLQVLLTSEVIKKHIELLA